MIIGRLPAGYLALLSTQADARWKSGLLRSGDDFDLDADGLVGDCSSCVPGSEAAVIGQRGQRDDGVYAAPPAMPSPDHLVSSARAAVTDGRVASISAYVADALAYQSHRERLAEVLHDLDDELGRPGADDLAWADRELGINAE